MLRLTNNSDNRVEAYLNKVEMDEKMFQSLTVCKNDSLKYQTNYFLHRDRHKQKDVSPSRFFLQKYLNKTESIEQALQES